MVHLNWSNFKLELSGKPDEDAEVHLLHSNDWMNTHHFIDGVKVQRFSLRLLGEAKLSYHSLEPVNVDWPKLQNLFWQRYSKVGNTQEQLFHAWRSFNFDENTETIDAYVTRIRKVATLLGYGEPQFLEVFKTHTSHKTILDIVSHKEDLMQAVETAKRILTKDKLDKQLTGQASPSPFMSIREGTSRKVSFDTRDELGDKIDKLTVMLGRLAAKDSNKRRPFKPQIYQSRGRGQNRDYSEKNYQNRNRLSNRSNSRIEDSLDETEVDPDFSRVIEETVCKIILEDTIDKAAEGSIGVIIIGAMAIIEVGIGLEIEHFQETIAVTEPEVQVIVD